MVRFFSLHRMMPMEGSLLSFHDQPPDVPVQADQFLVDCAQRRVLRRLDARLHPR